jgi:uncharacterized OB-fold protein
MTEKIQPEEILSGVRHFDSIFTYDAGATRSKFLTELRDHRKILGIRCPQCQQVYAPPRTTCTKCFVNMTEFVELAPTGTLTTYTIVYRPQPFYPLEPPFVYGIIKLDGADTGLVHFINEVDLQKVKTGMRVQAVFKKERTGSILDIQYFKPLAGEE